MGAPKASFGKHRLAASAAALIVLAAAQPTVAGPPYVTDDPEPTDTGHWEIYAFADGLDASGVTAGESGLDMNYGAARNLQLTLVLPAAYSTAGGGSAGFGTIEMAAKFRLLDAENGPHLAFFPRIFLPTATGGLGSPRASLLLPIWVGQDWGPWSVFGGGGWQLNPGAGNHDFWTGGVAVTRDLTKTLSLGAEVWGHTRDATDGRDFAGVNAGLDWRLTGHWSLLASGGPGIVNGPSEGRWDFYLALKADY